MQLQAPSLIARAASVVMHKTHSAPSTLPLSYPLPYGAILRDDGVQFAVYSRSATAMRVLLYDRVSDREPKTIIELDPDTDRWGDIWNVFVPGLTAGSLYHFQADGPYQPSKGLRFQKDARLIDPYARALAGTYQRSSDGVVRPPKCVVVDDRFDWQGDRHLKRPLAESVIYEMHVRGLTRSGTSGVDHPGTYLGVIEKIPYLQSLGVTAVELMPVHEFPILESDGSKPRRSNYWGYDPMAFFAPHRGYMHGNKPGGQVDQFKTMVRELHAAGIEVILDVVFNHTSEGNERGPTFSFKGLQNNVYYMTQQRTARYKNYSGCGNTVNGNHPICPRADFPLSAALGVQLPHRRFPLRPGFHFEPRPVNGELGPQPAVGRGDRRRSPCWPTTKIIAEAWDAAGAFQVGSFATLALGGVERFVSRRRAAILARRLQGADRAAWRPGMSGSSDLYQTERTAARTTASISSPPTTAIR